MPWISTVVRYSVVKFWKKPSLTQKLFTYQQPSHSHASSYDSLFAWNSITWPNIKSITFAFAYHKETKTRLFQEPFFQRNPSFGNLSFRTFSLRNHSFTNLIFRTISEFQTKHHIVNTILEYDGRPFHLLSSEVSAATNKPPRCATYDSRVIQRRPSTRRSAQLAKHQRDLRHKGYWCPRRPQEPLHEQRKGREICADWARRKLR